MALWERIAKRIGSMSLEAFAEQLMKEKGLTAMSLEPDVLQQVKIDILERMERRINATIIANLPEAKLAEFERHLDEESAEATQRFLDVAIPNLDLHIAVALREFRDTYLGRR